MSRYRIPKRRTRVEIRVSNSRFIATIAPVFNMKDARAFLGEVRKEMPDASHHVYAFKVGYGASVSEAMSDDGEPSGTAGPPALAVLRGAAVGDVALVITRYFGGTKLGTGGLVAAYSRAAKAAFEALDTEERVVRVRMAVDLPYNLREPVCRLVLDHEGLVEDEDFGAEVRLRLQIPEDRVAGFEQALRGLSAGRIAPMLLD